MRSFKSVMFADCDVSEKMFLWKGSEARDSSLMLVTSKLPTIALR